MPTKDPSNHIKTPSTGSTTRHTMTSKPNTSQQVKITSSTGSIITDRPTSVPTTPTAPAPTPTQSRKPSNRAHTMPQKPITRSSNKEVHPGQLHKAYDKIRQPTAAVQAEQKQKAEAAAEAERQRIRNRDELTVFEDNAQKLADKYKQTFTHPDNSHKPQKSPTVPNLAPKSSKSNRQAEREVLLRALASLESSNDESIKSINEPESKHDGVDSVNGNEEPGPADRSDDEESHQAEHPASEEPELVVVEVKKHGHAVKTSWTEVNATRVTRASTSLITTAIQSSDSTENNVPAKRKNSTAISTAKTKKPKGSSKDANPALPPTGLKKEDKKKKKGKWMTNLDPDDSTMLQEGKSIGFDDNNTAEMAKRVAQISSTSITKGIVKIKSEVIELPMGKAARKPGKTKFTNKHLPSFIMDNAGDRRILSPLAKEALGYVHSWKVIPMSLVQGILNRRWGEGKATVPENGKDVVTAIVNTRASDFRHELGEAAIKVVSEYIKSNWSDEPASTDEDETVWIFCGPEDISAWAQYQTSKYCTKDSPNLLLSPFHFRHFMVYQDTDEIALKHGRLENELILRVFAHYLSIVDAIPDGIQWIQPCRPFGVLELVIQAVEHALTMYHSGQQTPVGTFSLDGWGIKPLSDAKWEAIISGARLFIKPKRGSKRLAKDVNAQPGNDCGKESEREQDIMMSDPPEPTEEVLAIDTVLGDTPMAVDEQPVDSARNGSDHEDMAVDGMAENDGEGSGDEGEGSSNEGEGSGDEGEGSGDEGEGSGDGGGSDDETGWGDVRSDDDEVVMRP
ncbi:hypothetical protein Moror_13526 [Moniliophthora roreri MCA 2997]|uniref:Uncharacterized protein n=1 Tax=Moniliophthora roreri (strain MCA 2997) TaxID=1381753 RepID=V2WUE4_MONRO|nr:hypothetical protein Moror_13526 [Moniliophthora roreri MCA 2997]